MEISVISDESKSYNSHKLFKSDTQEKIDEINKYLRRITIDQIKKQRTLKIVRKEKKLVISRMFFNRKLKILDKKIQVKTESNFVSFLKCSHKKT